MAVIIDFESREQLNNYINNSIEGEVLGIGTEGTCYRGKAGKAYKIFSEKGYREFYPIDDIVTHSDVPLRSFAFPETIFTVNGEIEAYSSTLVEQNLFSSLSFSSIIDIDFDKLVEAYKQMITEADKLSSLGIILNDLPNNILFDGEKLVAVDTLGYKKLKYFDENSLSNYAAIDEAIKSTFDVLFDDEESEDIYINRYQDTIAFLRDVEANFKHRVSAKTYAYK